MDESKFCIQVYDAVKGFLPAKWKEIQLTYNIAKRKVIILTVKSGLINHKNIEDHKVIKDLEKTIALTDFSPIAEAKSISLIIKNDGAFNINYHY